METAYASIERLIHFVEDPSTSVDKNLAIQEARVRRVSGILLLSWLRARSEHEQLGPRELGIGVDSTEYLRRMVAEDPSFEELFVATRDQIDFRPEIPETTRRDVEAFVAAHYHPPLFDG